jgi:hypothetical protein
MSDYQAEARKVGVGEMKIVNSLKSYSDLNSRALIQILHRRVENSELE